MTRWSIVVGLALLAGCASPSAQRAPDPPEARGQVLAERYCSGCHAIGRRGQSPTPEAPPFYRLSENYRVDALEEALAEGISVGHPAMPQFQFAPDEVTDLVSYLQTIQSGEERR